MEVAVIGAGVFGAWTALLLGRAGHQATLIDRREPANEQSSSAGESRVMRSAYGPDEIYSAMARRSLQLWTSFFREENCPECFRKTGVLWIAPSTEASVEQARKIFERLGIAYDWAVAKTIEQRYPQFSLQHDSVGIFEPDAGAMRAERSVQAVVAAAIREGVRYEMAEIRAPVLNHSRLDSVEASDGRRFSADQFVFACGSWLPKLFSALGEVIRPTRQDLFYFAVPNGLDFFGPDALPIWIDQTEANIAYGFPNLGKGLKMGFHRLGPPFDPDEPRVLSGREEIAEAAGYLARRFPLLQNARLKATQVCHYENTPNGDFLIDTHPQTRNVWLVGGGSGHGFKHGPAVAEYVLDVIAGAGAREFRFSLESKQGDLGRRVL
ncbi:MAG: FAD-dependent oxidoreductase [Acidobacteriaceae bacterium]|nr:FAD-dependent oxidoreductase [Acidobacteriaceae bacterium]